ncbi:MAG: histidine kinase [Burkholderiaceae bacterium]|nr:histidine kinase [Burkholderiaceae bacterium]
MAASALLGFIGVLLLAHWLSTQLRWPATWQVRPDGQLELVATSIDGLKPHVGTAWVGTSVTRSHPTPGDAAPTEQDQPLLLQPQASLLAGPARWIVDDTQRRRHVRASEALASALVEDSLTLHFSDQRSFELRAVPIGWHGIGIAFWMLASLAWALSSAAAGVLKLKPSASNALYAAMALCQAGNLVCMAVASTASPALPPGWAHIDFPLRSAFDLLTLAAAVHLACIHPKDLSASRWLPATGWLAAALAWTGANSVDGSGAWWLTQATMLLMGSLAIWLMHLSFRSQPHPFALVMKRFSLIVGGTWVLVSAAIAGASARSGAEAPSESASTAAIAAASTPLAVTVWQVLFALVLLSVPFLSKSRSLVRELSLLAIISALAAVLDLLFVGLFPLGQFASLALALFLSMTIYAGARQWLVNRMLGTRVASAERLFEQLFRTTREVETQPSEAGPALARLLNELFDPVEVSLLDKPSAQAHTLSDGSTMLVPVPAIGNSAQSGSGSSTSILLRHAQQGRRLFTTDDARLADRIGEQLRRAVAFDQAVEQGRSEERRRLAQDLHDDIGARLLTLMYKAQSPEMEDYARHTLQDLKTLTRGLAASSQPLSHALAEWKADIAQRLAIADIELTWVAEHDTDIVLTMVQWSGLTRVLRELVSNVMTHAQARHVEIEVLLVNDQLLLTVADDGTGLAPQQWSPGLGVGGVRKRVRQLRGEVLWQERVPHGITCRVRVDRLSAET